MAVSQAFIFHFKCYSILHFAVCQLLCFLVAQAFRWQLTSIVSSAADIVDNADKKTVSLCPQLHPLLTPYASTPKKMLTVDVYASKDMVAYYPWQK